jgi:hypothetical protein
MASESPVIAIRRRKGDVETSALDKSRFERLFIHLFIYVFARGRMRS